MSSEAKDTIAAIATAPGKGAVGILKLSGAQAYSIAETITHKKLPARLASFCDFHVNQQVIDEGIALFFKAPNSFTGEDVVELQTHGSPIVLNELLTAVLNMGARLANPGEFSERAFLNNKLDLAQAEAIADLIESGSKQAAKAAVNALKGTFSKKIRQLQQQMIELRVYVEASIDFPEEEIDFLADDKVLQRINALQMEVEDILNQAEQGQILQQGMTLVLAGKPNAGKSSLLNVLTGVETAIVTHMPGTTRDPLKEYIQIDGMPLHIIDTAGLRETENLIEQEGVKRAYSAIEQADHILLLFDCTKEQNEFLAEFSELYEAKQLTYVANKVDLLEDAKQNQPFEKFNPIKISAKQQQGITSLREHLKKVMGYQDVLENPFTARQRHIHALQKTQQFVCHGREQLLHHKAGELLAEDLRQAQSALSEITGEYLADDLLGEIFSSFCIGK